MTAMKTELKDIGACARELAIELPADLVAAAIDSTAKRYGRSAKIEGFRPGKAPLRIVRARFRERILEDVGQALVAAAIDEAVAEHGIEPVAEPEIRGLAIDYGKPLTFTATLETLPDVDPGDYTAFTLRQPPAAVEDEAVEGTVHRLRQDRGRLEPITERAAGRGDVVTIDLERRLPDEPDADPERLQGVQVEIGNPANPPGFDDELEGSAAGDTRSFTVTHAPDDSVRRLAGRQAAYDVDVKEVNRLVLPALDDEFARAVGPFDDLNTLRAQVRTELEARAEREARAEARQDLLRQLAHRMTGDVPASLVARELERRAEQLVRRLAEENIDPRKAPIDWDQFREQQQPWAAEAVRAVLVLDEIARREAVEVTPEDVQQAIDRHARASGRTPQAARALIGQDDGIDRLETDLRREKAIALLMKRATIVSV